MLSIEHQEAKDFSEIALPTLAKRSDDIDRIKTHGPQSEDDQKLIIYALTYVQAQICLHQLEPGPKGN